MVAEEPFPHIIIDDFFTDEALLSIVAEEFSTQMIIEADDKIVGRRRLMRKQCEPRIEEFSPHMRSFLDTVKSDEFVMNLLSPFREYIQDYLDIKDDKFDLKELYKEKYFFDYDFSVSDDGYSREVHRDVDRRLLVFLFSLNDSKHDGGEICFYQTNEGSNQSRQHPTNVEKVITVNHEKNKAIVFLSNDISYHSVNKITNCETPRKFMYAAVTLGKGRLQMKLRRPKNSRK